MGIQIRLAAREFAEGEIGLNIRKRELRVKAKKTKRDEGRFKKPADTNFQMLIGFMAEICRPATSIGGSGHEGSIPICWVPFSPLKVTIACQNRASIFRTINCRFDNQMITLKKIHRRR